MDDKLIIACPTCDAKNRAPAARLGEGGKCGKCGSPLFQGKPLDLTTARFTRHANETDLPLVVDFWAAWCGPCKMMAPHFEAAAGALEPRVRLAKVDTDAERDLGARYRIQSIPTLILFHKGREVARQSGALTGDQLRRWVTTQLEKI